MLKERLSRIRGGGGTAGFLTAGLAVLAGATTVHALHVWQQEQPAPIAAFVCSPDTSVGSVMAGDAGPRRASVRVERAQLLDRRGRPARVSEVVGGHPAALSDWLPPRGTSFGSAVVARVAPAVPSTTREGRCVWCHAVSEALGAAGAQVRMTYSWSAWGIRRQRTLDVPVLAADFEHNPFNDEDA
jgi:hypothetical protein